MTAPSANKFRIALIQLLIGADKSVNLSRAANFIREAASKGAQVIVLPECFNSPYGTSHFPEYCEPIPGESTECLRQVAKETKTYVIGGSIPENNGDKIYNTCTVFNPSGELIAKYSKLHLVDIDVPGRIRFQESEVMTQGKDLVTFDTKWCKFGLGICYDLRFPELAALYAKRGCKMLLYPGCFNMTTGPAHWELVTRSRALDQQVYVAAASVARDEKATWVAWGNSTVVNPWGTVLSKADEKETIIYSDIDVDKVQEVRQQIPTSQQKRSDLYEITDLSIK